MNEQQPEPAGKSLAKYTIDLLKLAKENGFPNSHRYFGPLEVEFWLRDDFTFCAITCAAIQMWLRRKHKILVWAELTVEANRFYSIIKCDDYYWSSGSLFNPAEYEDALIKGLTHALENLNNDRTDTNGSNPGDDQPGQE